MNMEKPGRNWEHIITPLEGNQYRIVEFRNEFTIEIKCNVKYYIGHTWFWGEPKYENSIEWIICNNDGKPNIGFGFIFSSYKSLEEAKKKVKKFRKPKIKFEKQYHYL